MREFVDEVAVLSGWLGRDITADRDGVVPVWNAFHFRDAAVFAADLPECAGLMYLVRGKSVLEFPVNRVTIDQAYIQLTGSGALPAVA